MQEILNFHDKVGGVVECYTFIKLVIFDKSSQMASKTLLLERVGDMESGV